MLSLAMALFEEYNMRFADGVQGRSTHEENEDTVVRIEVSKTCKPQIGGVSNAQEQVSPAPASKRSMRLCIELGLICGVRVQPRSLITPHIAPVLAC
jgi:hypothetical protein